MLLCKAPAAHVLHSLCSRQRGEYNEHRSTRHDADVVLAGFSDPVYAEAYVTVHQYDIVLDVSVVNRSPHTLQVCLVFALVWIRERLSVATHSAGGLLIGAPL